MTRYLSALLVLAACTGTNSGEISLELGTGETRFETLADNQELPLVAGPQGGHHVWLSFRAEGLSSERVLLEVDAVRLDETEPPPRREPVRIFMSPADGDMQEMVGWPAQLDAPECLVGVPLSVRITLTDSRGHQAVDERIVVPIAVAPDDALLGDCSATD